MAADNSKRMTHIWVVVLIFLISLAALWRWSPLHGWLNLDTLADWADRFSERPWAPEAVIGIYVLAGLLVFPHTILVLATALTFDPVPSITYAMAGSLASASLVYGIGRVLRQDLIQRMAGSRLHRVSEVLGQRGIVTIAAVHIIPIAPFSVINLVAGATHIGFIDFLIGTIIGIAPGVLLASIFGERFVDAVRHPSAWRTTVVVGLILAAWMAVRYARRRFAREGITFEKS